jgi:hypothetical protein
MTGIQRQAPSTCSIVSNYMPCHWPRIDHCWHTCRGAVIWKTLGEERFTYR